MTTPRKVNVYSESGSRNSNKKKSNIEILPAHCCSWCKSYIQMCEFPADNVITVNNESAISCEEAKNPLKKLDIIITNN